MARKSEQMTFAPRDVLFRLSARLARPVTPTRDRMDEHKRRMIRFQRHVKIGRAWAMGYGWQHCRELSQLFQGG
jgi:hypothetical protein